jgi:hypothetical protein
LLAHHYALREYVRERTHESKGIVASIDSVGRGPAIFRGRGAKLGRTSLHPGKSSGSRCALPHRSPCLSRRPPLHACETRFSTACSRRGARFPEVVRIWIGDERNTGSGRRASRAFFRTGADPEKRSHGTAYLFCRCGCKRGGRHSARERALTSAL